jgi:hypothetical protein
MLPQHRPPFVRRKAPLGNPLQPHANDVTARHCGRVDPWPTLWFQEDRT